MYRLSQKKLYGSGRGVHSLALTHGFIVDATLVLSYRSRIILLGQSVYEKELNSNNYYCNYQLTYGFVCYHFSPNHISEHSSCATHESAAKQPSVQPIGADVLEWTQREDKRDHFKRRGHPKQ